MDYNISMISYIEGTIKYKTTDSLIILVQGLGYAVFVGPKLAEKYQNSDQVEFFIYQSVREDSLTLFGFEDHNTLELFKKLISISGIGPKSAMNILANVSFEEIVTSIQNDNPDLLTKVSGIGKKTAQRIVLELKNKIGSLGLENFSESRVVLSCDELDALVALGYSEFQAKETLKLVPKEITDISSRIKECLKYLSGR
jgi:Holliday junction DNA helicase RuvA